MSDPNDCGNAEEGGGGGVNDSYTPLHDAADDGRAEVADQSTSSTRKKAKKNKKSRHSEEDNDREERLLAAEEEQQQQPESAGSASVAVPNRDQPAAGVSSEATSGGGGVADGTQNTSFDIVNTREEFDNRHDIALVGASNSPKAAGGGGGGYGGTSPRSGSGDDGAVGGSGGKLSPGTAVANLLQVDVLHNVFLYISIPATVVVCILAIALYASDKVHAVTASHSVAGFCAMCAVLLSVFLMYCHLTVYTNPPQQRLICRILLMVPIYAIDSFIALVEYRYGNIVALVRDTYEAYAIYMFFALLMNYLGGEEQVVRLWRTKTNGTMKHLFPLQNVLEPVKLNMKTLQVWKLCLAQYMVLNPLLTLIAIPLYFSETYHDGDFSATDAYPYFAAIRFVSVTFAFTSLVYFFFGTKEFLAEHKPIFKFAAIKSVVFVSFWQSVLLAALNHFGVIPHTELWTSEEVTTGMQNFIVCIEMYIAAVAHRWVFTDSPYMDVRGRQPVSCRNVAHCFSVRDVIVETHAVLAKSPKDILGARSYVGEDADYF